MAKRDFYEVLGIQKGAGDDEIKKAYRKIAKECHPDLHGGDKSKEQQFKEANEAYEVLSDSQKRAMYDQYGHAGVDPSYGAGNHGSGFGFDDIDLGSIFESFFGGFGGRSTNVNTPRKGENIPASLVLNFEEAAFGCEREIEISRVEACGDCGGNGAAAGSKPETCTNCKGTGQVRVTQRTPMGMFSQSSACAACGGRGTIVKNPCPSCRGGGAKRSKVAITVKVPAGIDENQTVSIRGQGNMGANGGPAGDIRVTVSIRPHPVFVRDGQTVHCEVPITFAQAALGCDIEIPTLDGKVKLNIPEGTQPATVFRIKGKGIPGLAGRGGRGDQLVHVNVEVPKHLNKKQKEALNAFAEQCDEKNNPKSKGFFDKFKS